MSSEEPKPTKRLKAGVKLKTKPAVVPKTRKIKTKSDKLPIAALVPKGITKWNIIFTILFTGLLVATIINSYFKQFLTIVIMLWLFFINGAFYWTLFQEKGGRLVEMLNAILFNK